MTARWVCRAAATSPARRGCAQRGSAQREPGRTTKRNRRLTGRRKTRPAAAPRPLDRSWSSQSYWSFSSCFVRRTPAQVSRAARRSSSSTSVDIHVHEIVVDARGWLDLQGPLKGLGRSLGVAKHVVRGPELAMERRAVVDELGRLFPNTDRFLIIALICTGAGPVRRAAPSPGARPPQPVDTAPQPSPGPYVPRRSPPTTSGRPLDRDPVPAPLSDAPRPHRSALRSSKRRPIAVCAIPRSRLSRTACVADSIASRFHCASVFRAFFQ